MSVAFDNRIPQAAREIERVASKLVRRTALEIEADMKADMASPKSGRTYKRGKRGKTHQASAPGEAPAIDTSAYAGSLETVMDGQLAAEVGTPQETAPLLEGGTSDIKPRPAFERAKKKAENTFRRNAQKLRR